MKGISFDSKICQDLDQALKKEWLETNQFGGSASSTIICANTRRYHGLLIAQLKPPLGRFVMLSGIEEILFIDETTYPLSTQLYPNTVHPEGYRNLNQFSLLPFPTWIFQMEDLILAKSVILMHDEQTVLVRYQILAGDEHLVRLELKPQTAFRDCNSLAYHNGRLNTNIESSFGRIRLAGLFFYHNAAIVDQSGSWYRQVQYPEEKKLNLDFEEDLYSPFRLVYTFLKGREVFFCASIEDYKTVDFQMFVAREEDRRRRFVNNLSISDLQL